MLFRLLDKVLPSEEAEIPLTCQRTVAVNRLNNHLMPSFSLKHLFRQNHPGGIAGSANHQRVSMHRIYPVSGGRTIGNAFQPALKASFEHFNGQLHLRGKFQIHPPMQIFAGIWLGGILFIALFSFWVFLTGPFEGHQKPVPLAFPIGALMFCFLGLGLIHGAWRWCEDDIDHIKRFIHEHVGRDATYDESSEQS